MRSRFVGKKRWISLLALATTSGATFAACSLQDGGDPIFDAPDSATFDATNDTSEITDSSPPPLDSSIVDAGATFCDLTPHDAAFFFCADFDDDSSTHGFAETVTDGGSIAFLPSDAASPIVGISFPPGLLFETTLANPSNDNTRNALIGVPFEFADAGDGGLSFFSIGFDLRVNAIALDGAAPPNVFSNTFVVALGPKFAIFAPIFGKPNLAPVGEFGTADFNDGGLNLVDIGDGGVAIGEWNHFRFTLEASTDGGPSIFDVFENTKLVTSMPVYLAPEVFSSRVVTMSLGPSAIGPLNVQLDFDNVVVRSDKF